MAILNVNVCVGSRFICRTPESAAPGLKARAQPGLLNMTTPHCHVEAHVGTQGVAIDRTIFNLYEGHVPDAPVMLCDTQRYAHASAATGLTTRRMSSAMAAVALGALAGASAVAAAALALAVAHALLPAIVGALAMQTVLAAAWPAATVSAVWWLAADQQQWSQARRRFDVLHTMEGIARRSRAGEATLEDSTWCERTGSRHATSADFIVQQAALELMGLRREHGYSSAQVAAAM